MTENRPVKEKKCFPAVDAFGIGLLLGALLFGLIIYFGGTCG